MPTLAVPSAGKGGLNDALNLRFGKCDSITIVFVEDKNIKAVKTIPIHISETIGNLGIYVANIVQNNGASDVIIRYIGHKAFQLLSSYKIKIFKTTNEKLTVKKSIELYIQRKLKLITEPNAHLIQ